MDVLTLKSDIMHNELGNLYIFMGVETQVQRVYIQKISEVNKKPIKHIDKVLDIYGKSNGLLFSQSFTYVCIEDRDFISNEHAWETIGNAIGSNTLILWITNIDKRSKFYKRFADNIYNFEHMNADILKKHIKKVIPLSDTNCDKLMEYCEYDYSRCLLEIDKVLSYFSYHKLPDGYHDSVFEELLDKGVIYKPIGDIIFEFADAVIDRKYKRSIDLLHQYEMSDDSTLKALTVLYNTFKRVLQVQSCVSDNVASSTGLSDWEIKYANNHKGRYKISELVYAMRFIHNTEVQYKQGLIDEEFMLPYVLVNVL